MDLVRNNLSLSTNFFQCSPRGRTTLYIWVEKYPMGDFIQSKSVDRTQNFPRINSTI